LRDARKEIDKGKTLEQGGRTASGEGGLESPRCLLREQGPSDEKAGGGIVYFKIIGPYGVLERGRAEFRGNTEGLFWKASIPEGERIGKGKSLSL